MSTSRINQHKFYVDPGWFMPVCAGLAGGPALSCSSQAKQSWWISCHAGNQQTNNQLPCWSEFANVTLCWPAMLVFSAGIWQFSIQKLGLVYYRLKPLPKYHPHPFVTTKCCLKKLQSLLGFRPNIAQSHSLIYGSTLVFTLGETGQSSTYWFVQLLWPEWGWKMVMKLIKKKILTVNL